MSTNIPRSRLALSRLLGATLSRRRRGIGTQRSAAATFGRRAARLLAALTLLGLGLGTARLSGVAYADSTYWITQSSGWIGPDQTFTQTYTCPADYAYVGVAGSSGPGQLPYSNTSDSGVSASMDGGGWGSTYLTMLFTNWDPTSSHRFDISLACHGNGSNYQTDPTGGGTFTYPGGTPLMPTARLYAIFWRPTNLHYEGPWFAEVNQPDALDQRYENIVTQFLHDIGGSSYYNILTQYGAGPVRNSSIPQPLLNVATFGGSWEDTQAYPHSGAAGTDPLQDSDIQAEVQHAISVNNWPTQDSIFFVYTAWGTTTCDHGTCTDNTWGGGGEGAYHANYTDLSTLQTVNYALMADPSAGVGASPTAGHDPNGDYYADAEVDYTAHELAETVTDPNPASQGGWFTNGGTNNGDEVADLCAYDTPGASGTGGNVTMNGHTYDLQALYSVADNSCVISYSGTQQVNDTDPGIQYSGGGWGYYGSRPTSFNDVNNDVHATTNNGDSVSYTFNGTGISYISELSNGYGHVDVYIDGVYQQTVNANSSGNNQGAQQLYSISGLAQGQHTIKLVKKDGVYMLLDAFLVQHRGVTFNDTTGLASYNGSSWGYSANRGFGDYQNDEHYTTAAGDSVSFTFTGTAVSLLGEKHWAGGNEEVYLDGVDKGAISNNTTAGRLVQQVLYSIGGLGLGTHTLKVVNTSAQYFEVDGFTVQTSGQMINDTDPDILYQGPNQVTGAGAWFYSAGRGAGDYGDDVHATQNFADDFKYTFNGTGISFISELSADEGQANVYIDGNYQTTINGWSRLSNEPQQTLYSVNGLTPGQHTLMVVNESSSYLLLDALSVN
jgi:hypothetical protein